MSDSATSIESTTDNRPLPTVIGPTKKSLDALLEDTLQSSAIPGHDEWVYLNVVASGAPTAAIQTALQRSAEEVTTLGKSLIEQGLLTAPSVFSEHGREEFTAAQSLLNKRTSWLTDGISAADQNTTRKVLDALRANARKALEMR